MSVRPLVDSARAPAALRRRVPPVESARIAALSVLDRARPADVALARRTFLLYAFAIAAILVFPVRSTGARTAWSTEVRPSRTDIPPVEVSLGYGPEYVPIAGRVKLRLPSANADFRGFLRLETYGQARPTLAVAVEPALGPATYVTNIDLRRLPGPRAAVPLILEWFDEQGALLHAAELGPVPFDWTLRPLLIASDDALQERESAAEENWLTLGVDDVEDVPAFFGAFSDIVVRAEDWERLPPSARTRLLLHGFSLWTDGHSIPPDIDRRLASDAMPPLAQVRAEVRRRMEDRDATSTPPMLTTGREDVRGVFFEDPRLLPRSKPGRAYELVKRFPAVPSANGSDRSDESDLPSRPGIVRRANLFAFAGGVVAAVAIIAFATRRVRTGVVVAIAGTACLLVSGIGFVRPTEELLSGIWLHLPFDGTASAATSVGGYITSPRTLHELDGSLEFVISDADAASSSVLIPWTIEFSTASSEAVREMLGRVAERPVVAIDTKRHIRVVPERLSTVNIRGIAATDLADPPIRFHRSPRGEVVASVRQAADARIEWLVDGEYGSLRRTVKAASDVTLWPSRPTPDCVRFDLIPGCSQVRYDLVDPDSRVVGLTGGTACIERNSTPWAGLEPRLQGDALVFGPLPPDVWRTNRDIVLAIPGDVREMELRIGAGGGGAFRLTRLPPEESKRLDTTLEESCLYPPSEASWFRLPKDEVTAKLDAEGSLTLAAPALSNACRMVVANLE